MDQEGWILPFPKKGDLGIAKNYWGIILISKTTKIDNAPKRNCTKPKIEKILRTNQKGFRRNRSTTPQIVTIRRILGIRAKNLEATLLFVDFSKVFYFIHREMKQIILAYDLQNETFAAIMMHERKTHSPDGDATSTLKQGCCKETH